MKVSEISTTIT